MRVAGLGKSPMLFCMLSSSRQLAFLSQQFHSTRLSADELEAYLKQQEQHAKEAEFQALAKADSGSNTQI